MPKKRARTARKSLELLAPAGSIESFHAAVDAGANAVYCGVGRFNARARARNFTAKTLSYLVPYAHSRHVKVYLTFNTLLKQNELEAALHQLYQMEQIGVDAVIVQDIGLASLIKTHFPRFRIHASTQMALHNSAGVRAASRLGIRRVVLARELTLDEIGAIARKSSLELEVFCHGALCYSLSGNCLASSFLGGKSGNRGQCTQVCRRRFRTDSASGHFFSPLDFSARGALHELAARGVTSVKIEGRLKGPEYVHSVVSGYRKVLDHLESDSGSADSIVDFGRQKTDFFLHGLHREHGPVIDTTRSGVGIPLGKVISVNNQSAEIAGSARPPRKGEYVRLQPESGFEGGNYRVIGSHRTEHGFTLVLPEHASFHVNDQAYLTSRSEYTARKAKVNVTPQRFREFYPKARSIVRDGGTRHRRKGPSVRTKVFVKVDSLAWFRLLQNRCTAPLILQLSRKDFLQLADIRAKQPDSTILSLPPFVSETDLREWERIVGILRNRGYTRWMTGNMWALSVLRKSDRITADSSLWCTNRATQAVLRTHYAVDSFCYSLEDEYPNMRACASPHGWAYIYGRPPLFISRIPPAVLPGSHVTDSRDESFYIVERDGLFYTLPISPFCLFRRKSHLISAGIGNHLIDMSFVSPDLKFFTAIWESYQSGQNVQGSTLFNHKRGLC